MKLTILVTLGSGVRAHVKTLVYGDIIGKFVYYSDENFMIQILQCRKA